MRLVNDLMLLLFFTSMGSVFQSCGPTCTKLLWVRWCLSVLAGMGFVLL